MEKSWTGRDPWTTVERGREVLLYLIERTRITSAEEYPTEEWFLGYYFNDARYRILEAARRITQESSGFPQKGGALDKYLQAELLPFKGKPPKHWCEAYKAFAELIDWLKVRVSGV